MKYPAKGFTLIEFLLVTVIIGIISVVIAQILFQAYRTFIVTNETAEVTYQGWLAVQRMGEDIHRIRSAANITSISSNAFTFTDVTGTSISYQVSGSSLTRNGQILASNISAVSFSYFNSAGATTATPSAVKYIRLSVTAAQNNYVATFTTQVGTRT